jgi:hypothetical protein
MLLFNYSRQKAANGMAVEASVESPVECAAVGHYPQLGQCADVAGESS